MRRSGCVSKILLMKKLKSKVYVSFRISLYHGVSMQFLQTFSIDSAGFPCRGPAISSPFSMGKNLQCSHIHMSNLLIENGANIDAQDRKRFAPLHIAA